MIILLHNLLLMGDAIFYLPVVLKETNFLSHFVEQLMPNCMEPITCTFTAIVKHDPNVYKSAFCLNLYKLIFSVVLSLMWNKMHNTLIINYKLYNSDL